MSTKQYWLISFEMRSGDCKVWNRCNTVIDRSVADWLKEQIETQGPTNVALIKHTLITAEEFARLVEVIR